MADDDLFAAFNSDDDGGDDDLFAAFDSGGGDDDFFSSLDSDPADHFASLSGEDDDDASDDLFGGTTSPDLADIAEPPPPRSADPFAALMDEDEAGGDERPAWLREIGGYDEEKSSQAAPVKAAVAAPNEGPLDFLGQLRGVGPEGMAFGMTAQQRMILSVFLFLDISVLGVMLLYALGAIQF